LKNRVIRLVLAVLADHKMHRAAPLFPGGQQNYKHQGTDALVLHTHIYIYIHTLGECQCITTGTYNNMITYIQNVSYIIIRKCFIIYL
jgi:hypothetical protein